MRATAYAVLGLVATLAFCAEGKSQDKEHIQSVIEAYKNNYSKLKTVKISSKSTSEDRAVGPQGEEVTDQRGQVVGRFVRHFSVVERIIVDSTAVYYDGTVEPDGLREIIAFTGAKWHYLFPDRKAAEVSKTSQLPERFPIDPREAGSKSIKNKIIDTLIIGKIKTTSLISAPADRAAVIVTLNEDEGRQTTISFAFSNNLLPTTVEEVAKDSGVLRCHIKYRVLVEDVRFPEEIVWQRFATLAKAKAGEWQEQYSWNLNELVQGEDYDRQLFDLPAGYTVTDNIRGAIAEPDIASENDAAQRPTRVVRLARAILIALLITIVVILLVRLLKARRR